MKIDDLKAQADIRSFRPFSIRLINGEFLLVEEGNILFPRARPERIIVFTLDGLLHYFDAADVVSVAVS